MRVSVCGNVFILVKQNAHTTHYRALNFFKENKKKFKKVLTDKNMCDILKMSIKQEQNFKRDLKMRTIVYAVFNKETNTRLYTNANHSKCVEFISGQPNADELTIRYKWFSI